MTQRELGLKLEYEECNTDVRIAQYESGYRILIEMAKILNVNYIHFIGVTSGCAEDIMLTFLWLDEDDRSTIHLFQLVRNPGKCNVSTDKSVRYYDNDDWPATSSSVDEKENDKKNNSYQWGKSHGNS